MAGSPDLFWRIAQALAATAINLNLDVIGSHVYLQTVPDEVAGYSIETTPPGVTDIIFPAVLISFDAEQEKRALEDTGTKGWNFPARVYIADKNPAHNHAKIPVYLKARKQLFDAFDERPLLDVNDIAIPEVINVLVTPGVIFDPRLPNYQHIVSGMVVNVETEEVRA